MATGPVPAASAGQAAARAAGVDERRQRVAQLEQGRGRGLVARSVPSTSTASAASGSPPRGRRPRVADGGGGSRASSSSTVPLSPAAGYGGDALGHRRQPAAVHSSSAHASAWALELTRSFVDSGSTRRAPRSGRRRVLGHPAEALGRDAGDGAGRRAVRRAVGVERLGQPGPADRGERRVGDHLEVDLGAGVRHAAERAVPGVVTGGIVEQDQASGARRPRRRR